jgi:AbiTii
MPSLVLELQREALSKDTSVADLLRKALVVARKLAIADFETWVNAELNGYGPGVKVPEYRNLTGTLKVWNPYRGWLPLFVQDAKMAALLSTRATNQPISTLEAQSPTTGSTSDHYMDFEPEVERQLMNSMQVPLRRTLMVAGAQIHGIIDAVRNTILDWSLNLETAGILGQDMTFSNEEKARATDAQVTTYNVQNQTVIHGMAQSQFQQGTTDSTQVFIEAPLNLEAITKLTSDLRTHLDSLNLPQETRAEVEADLSTIEAQKNSPKPRFPIIRAALRSLKSVLEHAVGSAAGTALPGILEQLRNLIQ